MTSNQDAKKNMGNFISEPIMYGHVPPLMKILLPLQETLIKILCVAQNTKKLFRKAFQQVKMPRRKVREMKVVWLRCDVYDTGIGIPGLS
jgi:hypothetical protein